MDATSGCNENAVDNVVTAPSFKRREPPTEETVRKYMESREVFRWGNTSVLVDAFRFTAPYLTFNRNAVESNTPEENALRESFGSLFFLSHFHSDHYCGLHPNWNYGVIVTGKNTGMLLICELGIPAERIILLDDNVKHHFSLSQRKYLPHSCGDTTDEDIICVTLQDANHCPGASMFLFQHVTKTIVHTGDFRFDGVLDSNSGDSEAPHSSMTSPGSMLHAVRSSVDLLFLDNTFCDPAFKFARQSETFDRSIEVISDVFRDCIESKFGNKTVAVSTGDSGFLVLKGEEEMLRSCSCTHEGSSRCVHLAVVIGSYTIGKERIALAISDHFSGVTSPGSSVISKRTGSFVPIHVSESKKRLLECTSLPLERFKVLESGKANSSQQADESEVVLSQRPADFIETKVCPSLLRKSTAASPKKAPSAANVDRRLLFQSDDSDQLRELDLFLTIIMVPMNVVTYPHLVASSNKEACAARHSPFRSLFLWNSCYLPLQRFDALLAIEPTGWAGAKGLSNPPKKVAPCINLLSLPYSEHCSFNELLDFVGWLQPKHVIPTVSVEMYKKQEPLIVERTKFLKTKYNACEPLTRFAHLFRPPCYPGEVVDAMLKLESKGQPSAPKFQVAKGQPSAAQIHPPHAKNSSAPTPSARPQKREPPAKRPRTASCREGPSSPIICPDSAESSEDDVTFVSQKAVCIDIDSD